MVLRRSHFTFERFRISQLGTMGRIAPTTPLLRRRDCGDALTKLISKTTLALCFMIAGLLLKEMMGVFMAAKDEMAIAYAFFGFFIAELMKPKPPMEALRALFTSVHRNCLRLVGRV